MKTETLKTIRKKKGLSQWRLAIISGVSRSKLSLYEGGYMPLSDDELKRVRKALRAHNSDKKNYAPPFVI